MRIGLQAPINLISYISTLGLSCIILLFPQYIDVTFNKNKRWFLASETVTIYIIILLGTIGFYSEEILPSGAYLTVILGLILCYWHIKHTQTFDAYKILTCVLVGAFIVLILWSSNYGTPLFLEKVFLGKAHKDTLYHISISHLFNSLGYPSTGIDTAPFLKYHTGSHFLFGGLKYWTSMSSLWFYNISYAAIFVPLFLKFLIVGSVEFCKYKSWEISIVGMFAIILVFYSIFPSLANGHPFISESNGVALIFAYCFLIICFKYYSQIESSIYYYIFATVVIILISWFKVSVGMVVLSGVSYIFLRKSFSIKTICKIILAGVLWSIFVYFVIYNPTRIVSSTKESPLVIVSLLTRYGKLWGLSCCFSSLFGLYVYIFIVLKNYKIKKMLDIKYVFQNSKFIIWEMFAVMSVIGFLLSISFSSNSSDVWYFSSTHLFLIWPLALAYMQFHFMKSKLSKKYITLFLLLIACASIFLTPECKKNFEEAKYVRRKIENISEDEKILKALIDDLLLQENSQSKAKIAVYIPHSEEWYYDSNGSIGSPFIVPALSGLTLINGVPSNMADTYSYGYWLYKDKKSYNMQTTKEMLDYASKSGYDTMLYYKGNNNQLQKIIYDL